MSKRVLILVEGQTEERFVKDVLAPAFFGRGLFFNPTQLVTKLVKHGPRFKGGVTSFARFKQDAQRLLGRAGGALVTTMLDYYGLPEDFPGMSSRQSLRTPLERVEQVEGGIAQAFGSPPRFLPFLALHEFEAWLFCSPTELPRVLTDSTRQPEFAAIRAAVSTPEDINEQAETAPSKRIADLFPAYRKALHGPTAAARIGLERIRLECPHFDHWLRQLETFALAA
jgi:hypothetical protein